MKISEVKKLVREVVREKVKHSKVVESNLNRVKKEILSEVSMIQELSLEQLKQQWVDSGKMKPELFDEIIGQTTKPAYVAWLIKNVSEKAIKEEDIYKWGSYIKYFEQFQRSFPKRDINQYKGIHGVEELQQLIVTHQTERASIAKASGASDDEGVGKNLVSPEDVKKLDSVGIKLLGSVDGYQVFEVPKSANSQQAFKLYSSILGRCSNQSDRNQIHICTMAGYTHYKRYLESGPMYVFFNLNDPRSPYQFHYEADQFMDKNDTSVI